MPEHTHSSGSIPPLAIELIGQSAVAVRSRELVRRIAALDTAVLLVGESGIDVLSVAREIHERSRRSGAPLQVVACGEGDPASIDATLFGTSAFRDTDLVVVSPESAVALARGGSLFLRDVVDLSSGTQARLARLLRDGEVRVSGAVVSTDLRLIASAGPSIDEDARAHRFRPDLYRRLSGSRIDLPPLRARAADIPALAERVLQEIGGASDTGRTFTHAAQALLSALPWPRNLAGLREAIAQVVSSTDATALQIEPLLAVLQIERPAPVFTPIGTLREARLRFEREYIAAVLQYHGWHLAEAARTLGIQRPNLYRKARQLGIPLARRSS